MLSERKYVEVGMECIPCDLYVISLNVNLLRTLVSLHVIVRKTKSRWSGGF